MFSRRENLNEPCPSCGKGPDWIFKTMTDSAGRVRYPYVCKHCDTRSQLFEKRDVVLGSGRLTDDEIEMPLRKEDCCEKCGKLELLERHHWAPFKYFEDADSWPKSYLCRGCHEKWHQVMTGDLVRKHNKQINQGQG